MAHYQYTSLGDEKIRILRLLPGDPSAPQLEVEILSRTLSNSKTTPSTASNIPSAELPDFDALSYCWNPKSNTIRHSTQKHELRVRNSNNNGTALLIGASLHSLLLRLRLPNSDRLLWADAVCINQADEQEKARQIKLMPKIYSTARKVIVDLGEDDDGAGAEAVDLLERNWRKHIWSGCVVGNGGQALTGEQIAMYVGLESRELPPAGEVMKLPPDDDAGWKSVTRLFLRSWFTRIWVIQEFVLARQVVMLCGTRRIQWQRLLAGTWRFRGGGLPLSVCSTPESGCGYTAFVCIGTIRQMRHLRLTEEGRRFIRDTLPANYSWLKFQRLPLLEILHWFSISKATVAKDRYFALAHVADDAAEDKLCLRYEDGLDDIVLQVGRFLVKREFGGDMLAKAGLCKHQQEHEGKPSWIEDFTTHHERVWAMTDPSTIDQGLEIGCGGRSGSFHASLIDEMPRCFSRLLMVQAYKVDKVDIEPFAHQPPFTNLDDRENMAPFLWYVSRAISALLGSHTDRDTGATAYSRNGIHAVDAVWETLICGARVSPTAINDPKPLYMGYYLLSRLILMTPSTDRDAAMLAELVGTAIEQPLGWMLVDYLVHLVYAMLNHKRQAIRSSRGYFTSLPVCFRAGDEIWIVKGCRVPLLLRKSAEFSGCYQLVGSCYVYGVMQGEALRWPGFEWQQLSLH